MDIISSAESENDTSIEVNTDYPDSNTAEYADRLDISLNPKAKRSCKQILTPRLAAVLDKLKLSSRDTVHLLIAVLDAIGVNSSDYIINRTSIRLQRDNLSKVNSCRLVSTVRNTTQPLTVHWDTKLLSGMLGRNEERLSIVATSPDFEQIINIPDLSSGTGLEIASAVYESLDENQILNRVEAFVFDTTASNTGRFKGACTLLEKRIGRDILFQLTGQI